MQDYAARTITPLNKKVLGAGLVLLFLLDFIANLTDFLLPMVFSVMGKAAFTVSMLFWACAFLSVYLWMLLSPNVPLNTWSKSGLAILLIQRVASVALILISMDSSFSVSLLWQFFYFAGMMLFIWASYANLEIKVAITASVVFTSSLWLISCMYAYNIMLPDGFSCNYNAIPFSFLVSSAGFFVLVAILVANWWRR